MATNHDVVLRSVTKAFGPVTALTNVDLVLPRSQISVLLGPNGAGKTTATRIITGALDTDSGSVSVLGVDPSGTEGEVVRRNCGVVSAKPSLYDRLSGRDNLSYAAALYGLGDGTEANRRIEEAAKQFGIHHDLDLKVGGYSTGMKTRLALARAILHRPTVLLLDEPTSGLDPEASAAVLAMIREMTGDGRTVLLCTHLLAEAEGLADQIIILEGGANVVTGDPNTLAAQKWPRRVVTVTAENGSDLDRMAAWPDVAGYHRDGRTAEIELADGTEAADLILRLARDGIRLESVVPFAPTLEELYFAIRSEAADQGRTISTDQPGSPNSSPADSLAASPTPGVEAAKTEGAPRRRRRRATTTRSRR